MRNTRQLKPANYEQLLVEMRNGNHRYCSVCVGELGKDAVEVMSGIWPVFVHEKCVSVVHEWNEKRNADRNRNVRTGPIIPGIVKP